MRTRHVSTIAMTDACRKATHSATLHANYHQYESTKDKSSYKVILGDKVGHLGGVLPELADGTPGNEAAGLPVPVNGLVGYGEYQVDPVLLED